MTLTRLFDHISDKTQPVREGSHGLSVVCAITSSATNQRPARSAELLHVGADKNIFLKIEGDLCGLYRSTRCPFSIAWLIKSLSWMVLTLWLIISIADSKYEGDIHAFNLLKLNTVQHFPFKWVNFPFTLPSFIKCHYKKSWSHSGESNWQGNS